MNCIQRVHVSTFVLSIIFILGILFMNLCVSSLSQKQCIHNRVSTLRIPNEISSLSYNLLFLFSCFPLFCLKVFVVVHLYFSYTSRQLCKWFVNRIVLFSLDRLPPKYTNLHYTVQYQLYAMLAWCRNIALQSMLCLLPGTLAY